MSYGDVALVSNNRYQLREVEGDANANLCAGMAPAGGAVRVPVFLWGLRSVIDEIDLGAAGPDFAGQTQPQIAVLDADGDSYVGLSFSADDTPVVELYVAAGTKRRHALPNVASDTFALLGAGQTFSRAGTVMTLTNTTDGASVQVAILQGDRATVADGDAAYVSLQLSDSAGNQDEGARITWQATTVLDGATQDTDLILSAVTNGSLNAMITLDGSAAQIVTANADVVHGDGTGLIVGHSAQITFNALVPEAQVLGTAVGVDGALAVALYSATASEGAEVILGRSKSAVLGTNTIVASGDRLGLIRAVGADGGTGFDPSSGIAFEVDGTPGAATDMPGRILFMTSPDGSQTLTESFRVASDQNIYIANSNGIVVGHTAQITGRTGVTPELGVYGTGGGDETIGVGRFSADTSAPGLFFIKSRNGTVGSNTIVVTGDNLGTLTWLGADGNDFNTAAARINVIANGTIATNRIPADMVVQLDPGGADDAVREAMRIKGNLNFVLGTGEAGTTAATGGTLRGPDVATGGAGNVDGADLTIAAGLGTGTGDVGQVLFRTPRIAVAGDNAQALTTLLTMDANFLLVEGGATIQADAATEIAFCVTNEALVVGSEGSVVIPYLSQTGALFTDALGGNVNGAIAVNYDNDTGPTSTLEVRVEGAWLSVAVSGYLMQARVPFRRDAGAMFHAAQVFEADNRTWIDESKCAICGEDIEPGEQSTFWANYSREDGSLHNIFAHPHVERDAYVKGLEARVKTLEAKLVRPVRAA